MEGRYSIRHIVNELDTENELGNEIIIEYKIELCTTDSLIKAIYIVKALNKVYKSKSFDSFDFIKIASDFDKIYDSFDEISV